MSKIKIDKVISTLPTPLIPNTMYAVRSGVGFDLYMADVTGITAHALNITNITADYRQSFEDDGYIYSGILLNGTPVIRRFKEVEEVAQNVTDLEVDWIDKLTLTYV